MIGQNPDETAVFLNSFKEVAGINSLTAEKQEEFDELISSAFSTRFPGALLSYPRPHEVTIYYAIAATAVEWGRLRPLLIAFAGPTMTSFRGEVPSLQPSLPVEAFLLSKEWHVVVRLVPGKDTRVTEMVRRSLVRMIKTIDSAPTTTHTAPQPTNRLIAQFVDFLNGNNRAEAERILEICRTELRVDALNLSFMRIQLLAHFNDWRSVCEMPEFFSLCYTRKPPAIAVALLGACRT